ncbi:hypothetical protein B0J14DRAFT_588743 [Halenospora varia]|nr:hypothetical protein B0J14DRAFT_588743 [Halenospora varia]
MKSNAFFALSFLTPLILAATECPIITHTTTPKSCPPTTPLACPQPACAFLSTIPVPCGCPETVASTTTYAPCTTTCHGACQTFYKTDLLCSTYPTNKPTTYPTTTAIPTPPTLVTFTPPTTVHTITVPTKCQTITRSEGAGCPTLSCVKYPSCVVTSTVVNPCGCSSIAEVTSCKTTCGTDCRTSYEKLYLPCPFSPPPTVTPTIGSAKVTDVITDTFAPLETI